MFKRLMFLILCLAMLVGMGLATTAAIAGDGMYGEMRYRWEGFKNFDDWSSDNDDNFGFAHVRSRLGYSTEIGERGLFNMSVQNTRVLGYDGYYYIYDEGRRMDVQRQHAVILNEGYLGISDFLFNGFDVYAGRFALAYGRERVIGAEEWTFDSEHPLRRLQGPLRVREGLVRPALPEAERDLHGQVHGRIRATWTCAASTRTSTLAEGMYIEPYVLMMSMDNYQDYDESTMNLSTWRTTTTSRSAPCSTT